MHKSRYMKERKKKNKYIQYIGCLAVWLLVSLAFLEDFRLYPLSYHQLEQKSYEIASEYGVQDAKLVSMVDEKYFLVHLIENEGKVFYTVYIKSLIMNRYHIDKSFMVTKKQLSQPDFEYTVLISDLLQHHIVKLQVSENGPQLSIVNSKVNWLNRFFRYIMFVIFLPLLKMYRNKLKIQNRN